MRWTARRWRQPAQPSVVRRSAILSAFFLMAMAFNLALMVVASYLLDAVPFGIFFTSISVVNILFAPSAVLAIFYARHFVRLHAEHGPAAVAAAFSRLLRSLAGAGAAIAALLAAAAIVAGGDRSLAVMLLVILIAYTCYFADGVRALLQGSQRFLALGLYNLGWMAARFAGGILGLYATGRVWVGLAGILAANLIAAGGGIAGFGRPRGSEAAPQGGPTLAAMLPLILAYGAFIALTYLDVLVGYLVLGEIELGVYAGSAVLPKGVVMLTVPILWVLFPVMVGTPSALVAAKGLAVTAAAAVAASLVLFAAAEPACGGTYGIRTCHGALYADMVLAVLPLCLLRVLLMIQFARGLDWHPLVIAVPMAAFAAYALTATADAAALASDFAVFVYLLLGFYALLCLPIPALAGRAAKTAAAHDKKD